jgi:hypothetical protein
MTLTEYFNSLPNIDKSYNKYAAYSLAFNNPYKIISGYEVFKYEHLDSFLKTFIIDQGKCIVMPNMFNGEVIGMVLRSIKDKQFRYYNEYEIPYGAGVNNKPYYKPWIIVESALDSDFLRNFYPFVISTNGVSVSSKYIEFIKGTCSLCYCAFDNDNAGNEAFHKLSIKHSRDGFRLKRLSPPLGLYGKSLKDFGEILDCLQKNQMNDYDYYISSIKYLLSNI